MMDIAAVTVLYNPEKTFLNNIYSYLDNVELLIIVDNSEMPTIDLLKVFASNPKVKFITFNENKGIAKALNDGIELAIKHGFHWVLTMDQDSYFKKEMIDKYMSSFENFNNKKNVALFGPVSELENLVKNSEEVFSVTSLITSGSIINIDAFKKTGGYNEKLFIDQVDNEFCYRAQKNGFELKQFKYISLEHNLGISKEVSNGFINKKKKLVTLHSPIRLYYIVRNSLYVYRKYKKSFPEEMKITKKDVLVRIKNNLLYSRHKFSVLKNVFKGILDYKRNRYGKY